MSYELKIIEKEDRKDVVDFVRKNFMKDEPINRAINLITEEKPINEELENFLLRDYDNGISLKVIQNGNIIAISISSILEKNNSEANSAVKSENKDFNTIVNFLSYVDKQSDPFRKFPKSNRAITVGVLAVHSNYRGMGIAGRLLDKTWELGKAEKCEFMTVECSSYFTARALEKLGFKQIYRLNYEEYKVNGEIVFKTEPPHVASTVYVKEINS